MGLSIYVQHGELGDNAAGGGPVDSDRYILLNSPIDGVALAELNAAEYPPAGPDAAICRTVWCIAQRARHCRTRCGGNCLGLVPGLESGRVRAEAPENTPWAECRQAFGRIVEERAALERSGRGLAEMEASGVKVERGESERKTSDRQRWTEVADGKQGVERGSDWGRTKWLLRGGG